MQLLAKQENFTLVSTDIAVMTDNFAADVRSGLTGSPKTLPSKYFYDAAGSQLFEQITQLKEYYPTAAEHEILTDNSDEIASRFRQKATLIELGSGSSAKTRLLIDAFLARFGSLQYVPIDISRTILEESAKALLEDYHKLDIYAIRSTYQHGLLEVNDETEHPRLFAFLGSNIGNFDRDVAERFLHNLSALLHKDDRLLVGIDLRKERSVLEAAYDDAQGITAAFNMNMLKRINAELGGRFDLTQFSHSAPWVEDQGRIEMHLVSRVDQTVVIEDLDLEVSFTAGESIHTENSNKYSLEEIDAMAGKAGLDVNGRWLDRKKRFSLNLMERGR